MEYKYNNPVVKGFHPDPSVCRVDDTYYLVCSSFEYFPGVPIYKSQDLVNWELLGNCLDRGSQLNLKEAKASGGIYAPTIRYHEGTFFMTTTNVSDIGNFIVYTDNPAGDWSEPVLVSQEGIDPSLYFEDNKCYFMSTGFLDGNNCIMLCEINPFTGEQLSKSKAIANGTESRSAEAPHIYKYGEYYYLLLAEGGTEYGHRVTIQRSKDIYGPYEACPHNPILTNKDYDDLDIACIGHADLTDDKDGNLYAVCLGIRTLKIGDGNVMLHNLGRETFLSSFKLNKEGWPEFINNGIVAKTMSSNLPKKPEKQVKQEFITDFSRNKIPHEFIHIRNPQTKNYIINPEENSIKLLGSSASLSASRAQPTFIGVRQSEFKEHAEVKVKLNSGVAGISTYYNHEHHYDLILRKEKDKYILALRKQIYDLEALSAQIELESIKDLKLHIFTNYEFHRFCYQIGDGEIKTLGKGATAALCTEVTRQMTFTGTLIGMFSEAGEAEFKDFKITEM